MAGQRQAGFAPPNVAPATCARRRTRRDRTGVTPTIAMDVLTAEHYPFLVRHCVGRGAEIRAHGISVSGSLLPVEI